MTDPVTLFRLNKKSAFIVLISSLFCFHCFGQNHIPLNTIESGQQEHKACISIELNDGYFYEAQSGSFMNSYIDPVMICDVEYSTSVPTPLNISDLNTDFEVGTTAGNFDVSASGAATYSVPIYTPPGTAGVSPNLSLVYTSQGGNGLLGTGWSLAGNCISSISRTSQNLYFDGNITPVKLNNNDRFVLDGSRLIPTNNNGENNTIYKTEIENYSLIVSHGQAGDGPAYFTVETKEGLLLEYGNSSDSYIEPQNGGANSTAITWLLNKISDCNGNYFLIHYLEDNTNAEFRIDEINYTGNSNEGFLPYNKIKFIYETRADKQTHYINGFALKQNVLLTKIHVFAEDFIAKTYEMTYYEDERNGSHLSEIAEIGADGKKYNPLRFGWDKSTESNIPPQVTQEVFLGQIPNPPRAYIPYPGDFNGDGFTDVLSIDQVTNLNSTSPVQWEMYYSNNGNGFQQSPVYTGTMPDGYKKTVSSKGDGRRKAHIVDVNGNGIDDIIFWGINQWNREFYAVCTEGTTFNSTNILYPAAGVDAMINISPNPVPNPDNGKFELVGDFDGDGSSDIFVYYFFKKEWSIYNFRTNTSYTGTVDWGNEHLSFYSVEFDGDGKTDIMFIFNNSNPPSGHLINYYYVLTLNLQTQTLETISHGGFPNSCEGDDWNIFPGDFNGDGKTDFLGYTHCSGGFVTSYAVQTSQQQGTPVQYQAFAAPNNFPTDNPANRTEDFEFFIADFNSDGKSDIARFYHRDHPIDGLYHKWVDIYYSKGNNEFYHKNYPLPDNNRVAGQSFMADFNGDGYPDIVHSTAIDHYMYGLFFECETDGTNYASSINENKLSSITNGFNETILINYSTLSRLILSNNYTRNAPHQYPNFIIKKPFSVVKNFIRSSGNGETSNTQFSYENATINVLGKGFLGFSKIKSSNDISLFESENIFTLNSQFTFNYLSQQIIRYNGLNYSGTLYEYDFIPLSLGRFKIQNNSIFTNDYISSAHQNTYNFLYDAYGNITHKETELNNNLLVTTEDITYTNSCAGIPSKPELITTTTKRLNEPTISRSEFLQYDNKGNLTDRFENYQSTTNEVHTHFTYSNNSGLPDEKEISASGIATIRHFKYEYDPYFRFVLKEFNPLNQFTETTYDSRWGTPVTSKGIDGLQTKYFYDGFGRKRSIKTPDNIISSVQHDWYATGSLTGPDPLNVTDQILFSITENMTGGPSVKTYFDELGRKIETEADGFSGKVFSQFEYYTNGNLKSETGSFDQNSTTILTTNYTYQNSPFKRPGDLETVSVTDGSHTNTVTYSYAYSGGNTTVTTTDQTGTVTKSVDAAGKLVLSSDYSGNVEYAYFSGGQVKNIIVNGVNATSMTYNDYGYQITLTDKNAGTISYSYNALGELTGQIDAKGNVTTVVSYDVLGRVTQKTVNSANNSNTNTYIYTYNSSGINGANKLSQETVSGTEGTLSTTYIYDELSRLKSITENVSNEMFTTTYEYDALGNISKTTYPGGFATTHEYNSIGYPLKIKNAQSGDAIWQAGNVNARGQFTDYLLGPSGVHSEINYNSFGFPERFFTAGVQDLSMKFDNSTGNLDWRKDNTRNLKEEFIFPDQHRLISSQVTTPSVLTPVLISYNNNGTIEEKTDAGVYPDYDPNHPDAVKNITNLAGTISHDPQTIEYTAFNKILTANENGRTLSFKYGPDQQRRKTILTESLNGNLITTKYFIGSYEKIISGGHTYEINYINSPTGLCAMYVTDNGVGKMYYVYTDHLGSILKVTDYNGNDFEQNFDAWGRNRNPVDWKYTNVPASPPWLHRGYTGHEHLPELALINMNGRCYDPIVGMMLSPDNYVADATSADAYNRYSYALNNPFKYLDPSGDFLWIIPNIGISAEGGLSIGVSVVVGIPGALSVQTGIGYNFKSNDLYGYTSATYAFNSIYASAGTNSGFNVGWAAGMTPFSGFPVSTNLFSVGVNYNISNDSWSGNYSALQLDQNGATFNPSVSVMIFPERTTNLVRGQGFNTNDQVLSNFVTAGDQKGALHYYGFEGEFDDNPPINDAGDPTYYGSTDAFSGHRCYTSLSFKTYDILYNVFMKERFHYLQFKKNVPFKTTDLPGMKYFPEEALGFKYAYKNSGLYLKSSINNLNQANSYWSQVFGEKLISNNSFNLIYKIPRKW